MKVLTYILCALIVMVITFIIGAIVSGGFLTSEVPIPWLLVCLFTGLIGCLPIFEQRS